MPTKRTVLAKLTRDELRDNLGHYGLDVHDRRGKSQLVDALAGSRRSPARPGGVRHEETYRGGGVGSDGSRINSSGANGLIEGGGAGLGAGISEDGVTASVGVGGFYVAGGGSPTAPTDWLSILRRDQQFLG